MTIRNAVSLVVLAAAAALASSAASAQDPSKCAEAWYQRNLIYKDAGYCFKTRDAIATFGNDGCRYRDQADVPLSARERNAVADIVRDERRMGCRRL